MALRKPSEDEGKLLDHMLALAGDVTVAGVDRAALVVETMNDGGMGSLRLFPPGTRGRARVFGRRVSSWEFDDVDGVRVLVSLVVDGDERLYELELWKSDFGRLLRLPLFDAAPGSR
jgi:hypothetical protein